MPAIRGTRTDAREVRASSRRRRKRRRGANDNWVPLADGIEYARRLRAPLRTIADCGHLLIGEKPDVVVRAVAAFLENL